MNLMRSGNPEIARINLVLSPKLASHEDFRFGGGRFHRSDSTTNPGERRGLVSAEAWQLNRAGRCASPELSMSIGENEGPNQAQCPMIHTELRSTSRWRPRPPKGGLLTQLRLSLQNTSNHLHLPLECDSTIKGHLYLD